MLFMFGVWTPKVFGRFGRKDAVEGCMDAAHILTAARWPVTPSWHWCSSEEWSFLIPKQPPSIAHIACELWCPHHQCWWPTMMWWWTIFPPLFKPELLMKTNPYFCASGILHCHGALTRCAWQGQVTAMSSLNLGVLCGQCWGSSPASTAEKRFKLGSLKPRLAAKSKARIFVCFTSSLSNLLLFCGLAICYHSVAQTFFWSCKASWNIVISFHTKGPQITQRLLQTFWSFIICLLSFHRDYLQE